MNLLQIGMFHDPIAMIEHFGITIRIGGTTAGDNKASNTNDLAVEDRRTTGIAIARTIARLVGQTEHVVPIHTDGETTAELRNRAESVPLHGTWHIATADKATPTGDDYRTADGRFFCGQRYSVYLAGKDQGSLQLKQGYIVPETIVILVHNNLQHIDQDTATETIQ